MQVNNPSLSNKNLILFPPILCFFFFWLGKYSHTPPMSLPSALHSGVDPLLLLLKGGASPLELQVDLLHLSILIIRSEGNFIT